MDFNTYKILSTIVKYKTDLTDGLKSNILQNGIIDYLFQYFEALGIKLPQEEKTKISVLLYDTFRDFKNFIKQEETNE